MRNPLDRPLLVISPLGAQSGAVSKPRAGAVTVVPVVAPFWEELVCTCVLFAGPSYTVSVDCTGSLLVGIVKYVTTSWRIHFLHLYAIQFACFARFSARCWDWHRFVLASFGLHTSLVFVICILLRRKLFKVNSSCVWRVFMPLLLIELRAMMIVRPRLIVLWLHDR